MNKKPSRALDQALANFLKDKPSANPASNAFDDFVATECSPSPSEPATQKIDPYNPGEGIWDALEHELEQDEEARVRRARLHHPELPEELPDLSNL